jgi:nucleotide-binding universal stress UspA family protein
VSGAGEGPLLLCYDGSDGSAAAMAAAGRLIGPRRALVCHVWTGLSHTIFRANPEELPAALSDAARELDELDERAAEEVSREGVRLAEQAGFEAWALPLRVRHKTWRTLTAAAEEHEAALVVMGAHGMSGLRRMLMGSVSTAVVYHSKKPVLVVPSANDASAEGPLLLCYDGSVHAERAIAVAGELCSSRRALVLSFYESWVAEAPALAGASRSVRGMAGELDEIAQELSEGHAENGARLAEEAGFSADAVPLCIEGPPWRAVVELASERNCAAIVLGSRGLTGLSSALGSVSNGVLHNSRRPVLVVPPVSGD